MPADREQSRRDRILDAAMREFATHGFAGARVERIAKSASVNKQLLFHYFDSKAGLHKAVAEAVANRLAIAPPPGATPGERLGKLVDQLVRAARGYESLLSDKWRMDAVSAARKIVDDGQRGGHFRDDADSDAIAEIVVAASFGIYREQGDDSHADAAFVASLVHMVVDHCSWR